MNRRARCRRCGTLVLLCPQEVLDLREGRPVFCSDGCEAVYLEREARAERADERIEREIERRHEGDKR